MEYDCGQPRMMLVVVNSTVSGGYGLLFTLVARTIQENDEQ